MKLALQLQSPLTLPPCALATRSAGLGRPTLAPLSVARNMRCAIFCVRGRAGVQLPPDRAPMPWGAPTGFSSDRRGRTYLFGARSRGRGLAKTTSLAQKRVPFTTRAPWRLAHQLCAGRKDKRTAHPSLPPPLECTEKSMGRHVRWQCWTHTAKDLLQALSGRAAL
jgi:hypothetical protein